MDRSRMRWIACAVAVIISVGIANSCGAGGDLPAGYLSEKESSRILDKTIEVRLAPDLSALNDAERETVSILIEIGGIFQRVYETSRHYQSQEAYQALLSLDAERHSKATRNLIDIYRIFKGPIGRNLDARLIAILPVEPRVPGRNVYPWGIGKEELDAFIAAHPKSRETLLHPRTVVRRATAENINRDRAMLDRHPELRTFHDDIDIAPDPKGFYAVPYSIAFGDDIVKVSHLLRQAADTIEGTDVDFARYLRNRAFDLLRNNYEAGDASWVTGRFHNLNAQIGSYESYDDQLYGVKTFFSTSILARDRQMSESLKTVLKWMQDFENSLPYEHYKTVRTDIPVGVYNVIADFGQARGTNTATILPNEAYITQKYGRTILLRYNIMENPDIFKIRQESFRAAVARDFVGMYTPDGDFFRTMFHEIGHYLGIDETQDGRTLDIALEEDSSILEELKADLVSLFLAKQLAKKGYYSEDRLRSVQTAGIRRVLRKNQPAKSQVYATMQLMQMNYYLEKGMLTYDAKSNRLRINLGEYHQAVEAMLRDVLDLQYRGDKVAADAFIEKYSRWDDNLQGKIAESMKDSETYRYGLVRYKALGE